jgi:hypothetical protein
MSGTTGSRDVGDKLATPPAGPSPSGAAPDRFARFLSWSAVGGIVIALLIMIAASLVRNSWEHPYIVLPTGGFPWALSPHKALLPEVSVAMWAAALLGGASVAAARSEEYLSPHDGCAAYRDCSGYCVVRILC